MQHPILPVGALLAALLVLLPFPTHWRARNVATLSLIAWLFVVDIIYGVNTIVWAGNVEVRLKVWCDITTKIIIGASTALPAATACICKHLELVASGRVVRLTRTDKVRRMIFESVVCFGVPMVIMALHYVVQGHRFNIVEDVGCQPATYYSVPAIFVVWFPPLLLAVITFVYAALALRHFFRQRVDFNAHLRNTNSALNTSRWLRLVAMSLTEILWGTTFTTIDMYDNISPGLSPYVNWTFVHADFSHVDQFPLILIPPGTVRQIFLFQWVIPASSLIFFIFFGFSEESLRDYRNVFNWIRRFVFRQKIKDDRSSLPTVRVGETKAVAPNTLSVLQFTVDLQDDHALPSYTPSEGAKCLSTTPSEKGDRADLNSDGIADCTDISPHCQSLRPASVASAKSFSSASTSRIVISGPYSSPLSSPRSASFIAHPEAELLPPRSHTPVTSTCAVAVETQVADIV